ncbi:MAG: RecQ family zinc-binding domain-containing protein [Bacteroidales bacterium]
MGQTLDFNLIDFSAKFKLKSSLVHGCLKILEQEGYFEITDVADSKPRIKFIVERDKLYGRKDINENEEEFMHVLFRNFTGLFTEYTRINDEYLEKISQYKKQDTKEFLKEFQRKGLISYLPAKKDPVITFYENRYPTESVIISPENYAHRRERFDKRMEGMKQYFLSGEMCRSIYLLQYFGQKDVKPCEQCDICLSKKTDKQPDITKVKEEIIRLLQKKSLSIEDILNHISPNENFRLPAMNILRKLIDDEILTRNTIGNICLKKHLYS